MARNNGKEIETGDDAPPGCPGCSYTGETRIGNIDEIDVHSTGKTRILHDGKWWIRSDLVRKEIDKSRTCQKCKEMLEPVESNQVKRAFLYNELVEMLANASGETHLEKLNNPMLYLLDDRFVIEDVSFNNDRRELAVTKKRLTDGKIFSSRFGSTERETVTARARDCPSCKK
jgi:hypothetical protein